MNRTHIDVSFTDGETAADQTLRASELSYRRLFEAAEDGILILDAGTGRINDANPFLLKLLGFSRREMLGKTVAELGPFKDIEANEAMLAKLQAGGYVRYDDLPLQTRHGRRVDVEFVSNVYQAGHSRVIQCNIRDITARKAGEKALEERERESRALAGQLEIERARLVEAQSVAKVGSWHTDLLTWELSWSAETHHIFETDPGHFHPTREAFHRMVHPDDRAAVDAAFHQSLGDSSPRSSEHRVLMPDGRIKFVEERWRIFRDKDGAPLRAIGTCRDITELKLAGQALRESEERFRQLAENIHEVFWMTDPATERILYVSPAYEKIWGRSCASLLASGNGWLDTIHPDDRARVLTATPGKVAGEGYDEIYRIERPDGARRWIHDRAFPVRTPAGELLRVVGTAEDITARRLLEEQFRQSQKMEAIGTLAGGVAHDFNNILSVILGYSSLLMATEGLPEDAADAAREILKASERAALLTRQLLAFGRRQVMQARLVDLNEVVANVAKMLRRIVGEDIVFQVDLHSSPLIVRADTGMLDQTLTNLVANARDAMPCGGRLIIKTEALGLAESGAAPTPGAKPETGARLIVADTGRGISPENLSRVFEPFFTTKESGKGTGLGLSTVFGIVQQHGGSIRVESEAGRGATFEILLPLAGNQIPAPPARLDDPRPAPAGGAETIFVVEDDSSVRRLTRAALVNHGYKVLEAADGVEALRVWDQHPGPIHLLLTDMLMPGGVDGKELAARLRERNPRLPVIFLSGYSPDFAGRELVLAAGQEFVQKPVSSILLRETVRRLLDSAATAGR